MLELKPPVPKTDRIVLRSSQGKPSYEPIQRRLMLVALCMLLVALGFVLYHNRDFWFPDTEEAEVDAPAETAPATNAPAKAAPAAVESSTPAAKLPAVKAKSTSAKAANKNAVAASTPAAPVAAIATTSRTVLPPLEVEVIAGDTRRTVRPGTNSVRVDLQPGSPPRAVADGSTAGDAETAASVTSNAAEHVQMSADTTEVVSHSVRPGYPLLARQMKVQGSVILQALIGKDGIIQNLHVVSGPPILASAAQAAVRQWHFKPHYEGSDAVETQAKITVNFTISTN